MIDHFIKFILIFLIIFTPIAFGSIELWAFSIMELGILFIIILWTIQKIMIRTPNPSPQNLNFQSLPLNSPFPLVLLSIFLLLILFQMVPLPSDLLKIISPKTLELRNSLSVFDSQLSTLNFKFQISFFPFATQIEFYKWFTLIGLFCSLCSKLRDDKFQMMGHLIVAIIFIGVVESVYGMFEFFSGHKYILHLNRELTMASVTGTYFNRNNFAGYLLMAIPLSVGFLFSREATRIRRLSGWREPLVSLDGKTLLLGFGTMVMILGLLFSASRMGILSLLFSFTILRFLFRNSSREHSKFSRTSIMILGLALLWGAWLGLDDVISRFLDTSEDIRLRSILWVNTFQIFKDFPILGSGLGTFAQIFPMYRSFHLIGIATHAENDFLQLASEVGIIGIGLLLIPFLIFFYKALSGIRLLSHREPVRYIGMGGLVGILALMLHSLVERNLQVPANAFLYTILWAAVLSISVKKRSRLITK